LQLFSLPSHVKFARLVYLIRESKADHDMVLLAVADESTLEKLTAAVTANDSTMCKSSAQVTCVWIPTGVAVVPEKKMRIDGRIQWKPVK